MKAKLLSLLFLIGLIIISCNNPKHQIEDDAMMLIKMEKKIVELTIQLNEKNDPKMAKERDSIADKLQEMSIELQKKYRDADLTKEFQQTYDELKRKK